MTDLVLPPGYKPDDDEASEQANSSEPSTESNESAGPEPTSDPVGSQYSRNGIDPGKFMWVSHEMYDYATKWTLIYNEVTVGDRDNPPPKFHFWYGKIQWSYNEVFLLPNGVRSSRVKEMFTVEPLAGVKDGDYIGALEKMDEIWDEVGQREYEKLKADKEASGLDKVKGAAATAKAAKAKQIAAAVNKNKPKARKRRSR